MKIVLRKSARIEGHVEVVEVDRDPDKVPSKRAFKSEEEAIHAGPSCRATPWRPTQMSIAANSRYS